MCCQDEILLDAPALARQVRELAGRAFRAQLGELSRDATFSLAVDAAVLQVQLVSLERAHGLRLGSLQVWNLNLQRLVLELSSD
jgi:hypothetical protein